MCWYVDDTKISHLDHKVVSGVIRSLEGVFGKMTVDRGKSHKFVGMNFELLENGRLKILMKDYLEECIESFEKIDGTIGIKPNSPGGHDLFEVNESSKRLNVNKSEMFHHLVAKLLFVTKRARLDIEPTISFLCTRVTKSSDEDWLKLKRLLGYLKVTLDMPRLIGADSLSIVQSWADASYAVHPDMKGHTGGVTSFGHGLTHTECSKQKINTKSSTESEIVAASDYLAHTVWLAGFMKEQGYPLSRKLFYQDNMSAIQIEKNGSVSSGKKSRHINIRYFFIKDILKREGIDVKHCPTERMIADFLTKPLQGKLFKYLRDIIMGLAPFPMEERVELYENSNKMSIVEGRISESEKSSKYEPLKENNTSWADVVKNGKSMK